MRTQALLTVVAFLLALGGCVVAPASIPDRLADRAERASLVIDDAVRAAEAGAALSGVRDSVVAVEASVERARRDVLALHHDPNARPEDFRAALNAMRERNAPLLDAVLRDRARAASITTEREWKELVRD